MVSLILQLRYKFILNKKLFIKKKMYQINSDNKNFCGYFLLFYINLGGTAQIRKLYLGSASTEQIHHHLQGVYVL